MKVALHHPTTPRRSRVTSRVRGHLAGRARQALTLLAGVTLGATLTLATSASGSPEADDLAGTALRDIAPRKGFAYFAGHLPNLHNHPAIYAHGVGPDAKLTVVGKGMQADFAISDWNKALGAYEKLLRERGYAPPR